MASVENQPAPLDGKTIALNKTLQDIKKKYGEGAIIKMNDAPKLMPCYPTGIISLDLALGIGGLPKGRIVEIYGPESTGKTLLSLVAIAKTQSLGGLCGYIDVEHAMSTDFARTVGVNIDNLLFSQPDSGEQALEIAEGLISSGSISLMVVDSVAALVPRAEIEGEMGDSHVGLQARLMSQALRKLAGVSYKMGTTLIFINQLREMIGSSMYGPHEITPGGRALKFYASVRLEVRKVEKIEKGKGNVIGNLIKVKTAKNKVAPPYKTVQIPLFFDSGIPQWSDLLNIALENGIVQKGGAWFSFYSVDNQNQMIAKIQGQDNAMHYFQEHPDYGESILKKLHPNLCKLYSGKSFDAADFNKVGELL